MSRNSWITICLAYIIGLLSTNLFTVSVAGFSGEQLFKAIALILGLTLLSAIALKPLKIPVLVWWGAGIVGILAVFYFQLRLPQPKIDDIVYRVPLVKSEIVTVRGKVLTEPRLNSSHKLKFWLQALDLDEQPVSGKLYATISTLQGTGIDLGEEIELKGLLYLPQGASVAGGFDFQAYLARQGIFTGIQGLEILESSASEPSWGWWKLRRRILRSHLLGLGSPQGQLLTSMVLGRKAVDLPADLRDRFIEAGLAHVLAASGFHVSLLLGLILKLTNAFTAKTQSLVGVSVLIVYLGLTGIQASVLRACLMGAAVLLAITLDTKVKPLGSLLLAATLILIFNPLLIGDLGFQLSFLATFGLIATMPAIQAKLDWLPPTIATLIAVPLAASVWVLPLLSYEFHVVATYSIIVNIFSTPLITIISLGGMISAIAACIFPLGGGAIASLLFYPLKLLIALINFFTSLPGSSWAIGRISLSVLLIIYGLLITLWLKPEWGKQWKLIIIFIFTLIIFPIGYQQLNTTEITILPTKLEPVVVVRDRRKVMLIDSDREQTFQYMVLPFLNQQGINRLDYYVDLNPKITTELSQISDRISVDNIIQPGKNIQTKTFQISYFHNSILKLETLKATWLIVNINKQDLPQLIESIIDNNASLKPIYLISSSLDSELLQLNPHTIISYQPFISNTRQKIDPPNYYSLQQSGAIAWTPNTGFHFTSKISSDSLF